MPPNTACTRNAAGKGKCDKPNHTTIQAAVNDTSAKRVVACAEWYGMTITYLMNGRIAREWVNWDRMDLYRQLASAPAGFAG